LVETVDTTQPLECLADKEAVVEVVHVRVIVPGKLEPTRAACNAITVGMLRGTLLGKLLGFLSNMGCTGLAHFQDVVGPTEGYEVACLVDSDWRARLAAVEPTKLLGKLLCRHGAVDVDENEPFVHGCQLVARMLCQPLRIPLSRSVSVPAEHRG
jgi:hypothetical protein